MALYRRVPGISLQVFCAGSAAAILPRNDGRSVQHALGPFL